MGSATVEGIDKPGRENLVSEIDAELIRSYIDPWTNVHEPFVLDHDGHGANVGTQDNAGTGRRKGGHEA